MEEVISEKIYKSRKQLHLAIDRYPDLCSKTVLASSRNLDELILEFYDRQLKKKMSLL